MAILRPASRLRIGGGHHVRRRSVRLAAVTAALVVLANAWLSGASGQTPQIDVREQHGVYQVAARFVVPRPAPVAVTVLTDYDRIATFMPNLTKSQVLSESGDTVVVEQEAVAKLMMFSRRIHLLLEVRQEDGQIRFRDRSGRSFRAYEGQWRVTPHGETAVIDYELAADPAFAVPGFVLKRMLERDAKQMIEHLQAEIASRAILPEAR
ncbi:MAG TPA: SRPBCC family protein [Vicinamibacterales bacterium]